MTSPPNLAEVLEIPKQRERGEYGKGSITQRGNGWQISFYDNEGRRRRETYSTEAKAEKALNQKLTLKETGKLDEAESRATVDTIATLYLDARKGTSPKSIQWLTLVWNTHLKPFFGGYQASRITTEKLIQYRNARLEALPKKTREGVRTSNTTVNKELTVLRAIFYHAFEEYTPPKINRVPKFPEKLQEPPPRSGYVTDEQYAKIQAVVSEPGLKALIAIAYNFGFRKGEFIGQRHNGFQSCLRVKQIDMKAQIISLLPGHTKSDKGRKIKMTKEVYGLMKPCVEGKGPEDAVFTWKDGTPIRDLRGSWARITREAGVHVQLHDFRRSAVRNLIRAGVSQATTMKISGHATDSMLRRYDITADDDLVQAANTLDARRAGQK